MIARLAGIALVLALPVWASAHGEHGAARPLGARSVVSVHGFEVELLSQPSPLARDRESHVIARISTDTPPRPVSGGEVRIGLGPVGLAAPPQPAPEVTWAGSYTATFTPAPTGAHRVAVVLETLEGRRFEPPVVVEFPIDVAPAPGMSGGAWALLLFLVGATAFGLYGIALRAKLPRPAAADGLNLLAIPWVGRILTAGSFQPSLQVPLLGLMGVVAVLGFTDVQEGGVNVATKLKPVTYLGLVESALLLGSSLVVVPLVVLGGTAVADRLAGPHGLGLRRTSVVFGYMFVPIGLGMHLAHNLAHLLLEGAGIVPGVQRAAAVYTPFRLGTPDWEVAPLASEPVVLLLQMAVVAGFFLLSLAAAHRLSQEQYGDPRAASRAVIPMAALALLFTLAGVGLLNQPMGMRHRA
jgi:hypothetical protein